MYLLRWRFDYKDRPTKWGMWSNPGNNKATQAWCNNHDSVVLAAIEGKDLVTKEIKVLASCSGHEFRNFQWIGTAKINPGFRGQVTPITSIIGMKLMTSDQAVSIFVDGKAEVSSLSKDDKEIQFATFGR